MEYKAIELEGRRCWLLANQDSRQEQPLIIMPGQEDSREKNELIAGLAAVEKPFLLAGFESDDWNREFSPWPASGISKKSGPFLGEGRASLSWMLESFIAEIEASYNILKNEKGLLGYSLAGMFSLWAMTESAEFNSCASCSGSLWYEGWLDYAAGKKLPTSSIVYLSLGQDEELTKNPVLSRVGDVTRSYAQILGEAENIKRTTLAWSQGGHFKDVEKRQAAALKWLLEG